MMLGLGLGLGFQRPAGPPMYMYFGSVLYQILEGEDSAPLMGDDGFYLYGVAQ